MLKLRLLLLLLVVWCGSVLAGGPPTITFAPTNPTTADTITATLSMPTCGGVTTAVRSGLDIIITTVEGLCGVEPPFTMATLPPIQIAGTLNVRWLVAPSQTPVATATLIVAPSITFTPPNPTTIDTITATLSRPTCGGATAVVAATQITLTTVEGGCGVPPPFTFTRLGPIGAGTYQVQWFIAPSQTPVATATLIVAGAIASDPAPALSYWAMLLLVLVIAAFAARYLRDVGSRN